MKSITVITGPTASGKTARALALAKEDPRIEIVNADASALYKGFDIGTAKPSPEEQRKVAHHLIDILEPHEMFSAADYSIHARALLRELIATGKNPIVVGGTGLYIDALFKGLLLRNASDDEMNVARQRATIEIEAEGFDAMHSKLETVDPILYKQIQRERNPIRLHRAWEYYYATGRALGEAREIIPQPFEYEPEYTVLQTDRPLLWQRIEERTDRLLAMGWTHEVKGLLERGVTVDAPAMRAIGYREIAGFLYGECDMKLLREKIVIATRQYAKRQVTWMKRYITA